MIPLGGFMPNITDHQIDFLIIAFLKQEEASSAWLADRIGVTRDRAAARLQSLRRRGLVAFNRVSWRYNGPGVKRTRAVSRL